jgi:hypothetical protein
VDTGTFDGRGYLGERTGLKREWTRETHGARGVLWGQVRQRNLRNVSFLAAKTGPESGIHHGGYRGSVGRNSGTIGAIAPSSVNISRKMRCDSIRQSLRDSGGTSH